MGFHQSRERKRAGGLSKVQPVRSLSVAALNRVAGGQVDGLFSTA